MLLSQQTEKGIMVLVGRLIQTAKGKSDHYSTREVRQTVLGVSLRKSPSISRPCYEGQWETISTQTGQDITSISGVKVGVTPRGKDSKSGEAFNEGQEN